MFHVKHNSGWSICQSILQQSLQTGVVTITITQRKGETKMKTITLNGKYFEVGKPITKLELPACSFQTVDEVYERPSNRKRVIFLKRAALSNKKGF